MVFILSEKKNLSTNGFHSCDLELKGHLNFTPGDMQNKRVHFNTWRLFRDSYITSFVTLNHFTILFGKKYSIKAYILLAKNVFNCAQIIYTYFHFIHAHMNIT